MEGGRKGVSSGKARAIKGKCKLLKGLCGREKGLYSKRGKHWNQKQEERGDSGKGRRNSETGYPLALREGKGFHWRQLKKEKGQASLPRQGKGGVAEQREGHNQIINRRKGGKSRHK